MDLDPLCAVMVCIRHRMLGLSHGLETESSPSHRWTLSPWAAMTWVKVVLSIRACSAVVSRSVKNDLCDACPVQQTGRAQTLLVDAPTSEDPPDVPGQRLSSEVDARRWMVSRLSLFSRDVLGPRHCLPHSDSYGDAANFGPVSKGPPLSKSLVVNGLGYSPALENVLARSVGQGLTGQVVIIAAGSSIRQEAASQGNPRRLLSGLWVVMRSGAHSQHTLPTQDVADRRPSRLSRPT